MNTAVHYESILRVGRASGAEQGVSENLPNKLDDPKLC